MSSHISFKHAIINLILWLPRFCFGAATKW